MTNKVKINQAILETIGDNSFRLLSTKDNKVTLQNEKFKNTVEFDLILGDTELGLKDIEGNFNDIESGSIITFGKDGVSTDIKVPAKPESATIPTRKTPSAIDMAARHMTASKA